MAPRKSSRTTRSVATISTAPLLNTVVNQPSFKPGKQKSKKATGKGARATRSSAQTTQDVESGSDANILRWQQDMADEMKRLRQMIFEVMSSITALRVVVSNVDDQTELTHHSIDRILDPVSLMATYGEKMNRKMSKHLQCVETLDAKLSEMHKTIDEMNDTQFDMNDTVYEIRKDGADEDTSERILAKLTELEDTINSQREEDQKLFMLVSNKLCHLGDMYGAGDHTGY